MTQDLKGYCGRNFVRAGIVTADPTVVRGNTHVTEGGTVLQHPLVRVTRLMRVDSYLFFTEIVVDTRIATRRFVNIAIVGRRAHLFVATIHRSSDTTQGAQGGCPAPSHHQKHFLEPGHCIHNNNDQRLVSFILRGLRMLPINTVVRMAVITN